MSLKEFKKIDSRRILKLIKDNYDKDAALFTAVLFLIIFFGIRQGINPALVEFNKNMARVVQKQEEIKPYLGRLDVPSATQPQQNQKLPINIYESPYPGMDTESACSELVQEIIQITKQTGNNRINQVDFTTQEVKDDSGTKSDNYGILSLNLSVEGPYASVQNMLNEIYLMNYLVVIKSINSTPTEDFQNLNTDLTLDLYVKLDGHTEDNNKSNNMKSRFMRRSIDRGSNNLPMPPAG